MFAVCIVLPRIYEEPLLVTTWTYTWQSLEIVCDCESVVHKVDVPAGTSWPLLARCPARGSILASAHLPSNPLVFAFWVVANGRFELQFWGKVIGTVIECSCSYKTMWPSPFSRPLPSPYTMLKLGKNSGSMRSNLFMGLVGGGGGGDGYALSKVLSSGFRSNFCFVCRTRCLQDEG